MHAGAVVIFISLEGLKMASQLHRGAKESYLLLPAKLAS
jgi:hypothetical protein